MLILAGRMAVAQPAPCDVGSQSVLLAAPATRGGYHLDIAAGGGPSHGVQVDTGSTGIAIQRDTIKAYRPVENSLPDYIYYNSSGNLMCGEWVATDVTLSDANKKQVRIPGMQVLAVDYTCKVPPPLPPDPCRTCRRQRLPKLEPGKPVPGPAMLGVGFDRGVGMGGPRQNAFLQLPQMNAGTMQRGYVITTAGIRLGMTPADVAGFRFVPLTPTGNAKLDYDWQQAPGCVSIEGGGVTTPGRKVCGNVLMDTGVDRMYVSYRTRPLFQPPLSARENLWDCCGVGPDILPCVKGRPACIVNGGKPASVTVTWPASGTPVYTYIATSPQQFWWNRTSPIFAHLGDDASPANPNAQVFVNTSRQLLYAADYLYDATCGRIGFRPKVMVTRGK